MIGHHLFTNRQPNTGAPILALSVQPLKHLKDAVYVLLIEANCTSSTKGGQMGVKREERLLPTLNSLKNMVFPSLGQG